ncbi:acyl carrier protein [Spongiactinospora sp. TRM90649]|uniref:acyl carrier protein n=1 Tax=Spongiactinospora sp. TRM90649 TaxID=3031114 RepID=UPI0023F9D0CA|nr:acyl carrier protein [Spongiactinospora sp. TRM90649]MDF5754039.1 acyl carrier protein [Spongiactinospora sp. TRM90649]
MNTVGGRPVREHPADGRTTTETTSGSDSERVRERLAELVATATDGEVTADEALTARVPLSALGVTSLAQMRLIDAIEREFGVDVDFSDESLATLDDLGLLTDYVNGRTS